MTGIRITAVVVASAVLSATLVVAGVASAGTSGATGVVTFTASYSGKGKGDASKQPCVPFTGTGEMAATNGSATLQFQVLSGSEGCGDEAGKVFSVSGRVKVTGGTGSLAGATGSLKMTGVYDRGAGTFSIKFSGPLTTAGGAAAKPTVLKITGGAKNKLRFSKRALVARAGVVTISMRNLSNVPHNVAIRAGASAKSKIIAKGKVVRKGKVSTVKANLKKGKYRYVCTVRGHEKAGMWGILTVK